VWCGVVWCGAGYRPQPWAWTWTYVGDTGRFTGRWDDPLGSFRTLRRANLLSCLLEVLAVFRPDPLPGQNLDGIVEDPADAQLYPTQPPGTVPLSWLAPRQGSTATLSGIFCAVTDEESLPTLRDVFLSTALRYGLADLDAGALRFIQAAMRWVSEYSGRGADRRAPRGPSDTGREGSRT